MGEPGLVHRWKERKCYLRVYSVLKQEDFGLCFWILNVMALSVLISKVLVRVFYCCIYSEFGGLFHKFVIAELDWILEYSTCNEF